MLAESHYVLSVAPCSCQLLGTHVGSMRGGLTLLSLHLLLRSNAAKKLMGGKQQRRQERRTGEVRTGFCAETVDGDNGDCETGDRGSWMAAASSVRTIDECASMCAGCRRCNYVSFSLALNDCSWHHTCRLDGLRTDVSGFESTAVPAAVKRNGTARGWSRVPRPPLQTSSVPGLCGITWRAGDCDAGSSGTASNRIGSLAECEAFCRDRCGRCAFVSFSRMARDCSWFSRCDLDNLRRPPPMFPDYLTSQLKPASLTPPPLPLASLAAVGGGAPLRVALMTAAVGSPMRCALVQWCQGAKRLGATFERLGWTYEVVIINQDEASEAQQQRQQQRTDGDAPVTADCPGAKVMRVPIDLATALDGCTERWKSERDAIVAKETRHSYDANIRTTRLRQGGAQHLRRNFYKWVGFRLDYDAVFVADVDIDLLPHEQNPDSVGRLWEERLPKLLALSGTVYAVGNPDHSAPLNNGLFVALPSKALYEDGLAVLRSCRFNFSHGWDHVGPPRSLGLDFQHLDGTHASDMGGFVVETFKFLKVNNWDFLDGRAGQGFFWYMLCVRHRVCRYSRWSGPHKPMHWWGGGEKAWELPQGGMRHASSRSISARRDYLSRTDLLDALGAAGTPCLRRLWSMQRQVDTHQRFEASWKPGVQFVPNPIFPIM